MDAQLADQMAGVVACVRAATLGSFTAAAQAGQVSVAAVSKSIASLEARLGARLFQRAGRRAVLTAEGQAFVAHARQALEQLSEAAAAATPAREAGGVVRITTAPGFGKRYLVPLLPELAELHPALVVDLQLTDRNVDLVGEGFDIGIRGGSAPPEGMVGRKVCDIRPVLVAAPAYLAQRGCPQQPADLAGHRLIGLRLASGRHVPWRWRHPPAEPPASRTALVVSDPEAALVAAIAGFGIAQIAWHHACDAVMRGDLQLLLPRSLAAGDGSIAMFYPSRRGIAARVRILVEFLLERWSRAPGLVGGNPGLADRTGA